MSSILSGFLCVGWKSVLKGAQVNASLPLPDKRANGMEKGSCKLVELAENHEKAPLCPWTGKYPGNDNQYE